MGKDRKGSVDSEENGNKNYKGKAREFEDAESDSENDTRRHKKNPKRRSRSYDAESGSGSDSEESESVSEDDRKHHKRKPKRRSKSNDSESEDSDSDSENDRKRHKRKRKRRSRSYDLDSDSESEEERRKRRRKKKEREKRMRREKEEERERKRKKKKREKEKKKKEKLERGKKGAVTNSWGKYGVIRETDMWNKRPEFTAWLAEVKQVNLESLPNWEEKQMFKEFMEDHNTATFPSKKYYNLDTYYKRQMEKEMKRGFKRVLETERTVFNDEEQRRQELMREREKQKEQQVEALKISMQTGMAQAMKEQALLKEEMAYQYKLGNFEAAAAIQKRLDPDVPM